MSRSLFVVVDSLKALSKASMLRSFPRVFLAPSPPSAAGHLGLVRAHPGLGDLTELLTPEAFLLDAALALGASALRQPPVIGGVARTIRDLAPDVHAKAEAAGDAETAKAGRLYLALLDAEEGRLEDALDALKQQAAESPDRLVLRLSAAAVCELTERADEADRWVACVAGDLPPREYSAFQYAVVVAALGGAPGAVAGSQAAVASAALRFINNKLWGPAFDGEMSMVRRMFVTGLINRCLKRRIPDVATPGVFRLLLCGTTGSSEGLGYPVSILPEADGSAPYVLRASQALLSAVLRTPPLCAERIRAATTAAERDLARAVEGGDTPAAAADLYLLLAFLAARDGRFDEALQRYLEAARDHPSDPRPRYLASMVLSVADKTAEADKWKEDYERLAAESSEDDRVAHKTLGEELVVALALGGARTLLSDRFPSETVATAATRMLDAALVSVLEERDASIAECAEVVAIRALC